MPKKSMKPALRITFTKKQARIVEEAMQANDIVPRAKAAFLTDLAKEATVRTQDIEVYG